MEHLLTTWAVGRKKSVPQGLKPAHLEEIHAKAEALAYLEAEALADLEAEALAYLEAGALADPEAEALADLEAETLADLEAETLACLEAEAGPRGVGYAKRRLSRRHTIPPILAEDASMAGAPEQWRRVRIS